MWWWRSVVLFGICLVANGNGQWARDSLMAEFDLAHIHDSEPVLTRRIRQSNTNQVSSLENHSNQEQSPLICHQCRSFEDGDRCIHLPTNSSIFSDTCGPQHTACMVISMPFTSHIHFTHLQSFPLTLHKETYSQIVGDNQTQFLTSIGQKILLHRERLFSVVHLVHRAKLFE